MSTSVSQSFYDISKIPKDWTKKRLKNILSISENKSSNFNNEKVLSLTQKGIIVNDISNNKGQIAESYEKYILVKKGQICMNPMDLLSGWVDISSFDGLISPAYYTFELNEIVNNKFISYFLQSNYFRKTFFKLGKGVASHDNFGRWVLTPDELKNICIFIPNIKKQKIIASYLDNKIEILEVMIEKIRNKIELIKEQRTSLINQYVTKGLDPNVEMKDSGVEWIREIPKHWNLMKLKYLVSYNTDTLPEDTDPDYSFNYIEISDVNHIEGVNLKEKITFDGRPSRAKRVVKPNDVIISTVRTYLRAIGIIPDIPDVVCSTGFCVLRDRTGLLNQNFLSYSVKSEWFVSSVISNSYGVSYPAINSSELVEFKIVLPPLKEQEEIVKTLKIKIQNFDDQIKFETKRVDLLKEYSQSLISSVVTGKVRITENMI